MALDLIRFGFVLVALGLVSGLFVQRYANPRMGLTNHLIGIINGLLLVALGLVWPRLDLPHGWLVAAFWLAVYSGAANWLVTFLAAVWNGGGQLMPFAAHDRHTSPGRERLITLLLISLSLTIIAAVLIVIAGLR